MVSISSREVCLHKLKNSWGREELLIFLLSGSTNRMDRLIYFMYELHVNWVAPTANLTMLRKMKFLDIALDKLAL